MLKAALVFLLLAISAYVMGETGTAGLSLQNAQVCMIFFMLLMVITAARGLSNRVGTHHRE